MVSAAMLALSSLSNSSRYVGILYAALIFFTPGDVRRAHVRDRRHRGISWMSFSANLTQVGDAIFRLPLRYETPWPVSLLMIVAAGRRLRRRARAPRPRRRGGGVTARSTPMRRAPTHVSSKWYGQVIGLNDVTLTVPPGITGLLGPNGAGKSTFMKLITGQLKPSKGDDPRARRADLGEPGALLPHRLLSRAGRVLRADDRARVGDARSCG